MRDLLAALGPAVSVFMPLEPWPAATLLAVARDRGWLNRPRRLALVWATFGGMPMDWERFSSDRIADFAAWPDDGKWRRAFADRIVESVTAWGNAGGSRGPRIGGRPADPRTYRPVSAGEIGAGALSAAFPDMAPDRLEARLKALCDERLRLEPVPAFPGAGGAAEERWRIFDPEFRFWVAAGMPRILQGSRWLHTRHGEIEYLVERMEAMEKDALAQFRRDCGDDWTEPPDRGPGQAGQRGRTLPRKAAPVERRAFAFAVTAPGVLEGVLVPYGVPIHIGEASGSGGQGFEEVFEPGSLEANGLLVNVPQPVPDPRGRPLARTGKDLELRDGPDAMRAMLTLPDTIDGRRVRARVDAGELTAFSAAFQVLEEEWTAPPAPDRVQGDRRIVRRARLVGLALMDRPEHASPLVDGGRVRPGAV